MKAIEHMQNARDELQEAKNKAALGTDLMLSSLIDELESLIERTENINDSDEND